MLINMIHTAEPLFAKRHERWVAFVFQVLTTCYLQLHRSKIEHQKKPLHPPRDAHVHRALDPISCHKGFRTAGASESRERKHFPCRDEWPPCDLAPGAATLDTKSFADSAGWERGRQHFAHREEELGHLPTEPFATAVPWDRTWLQLFTILIYLA